MGLADDWKRLDQLEQVKGTLQYGQNLQITPSPANPDLVLASKDLIRFVGEKTDVNAWRVYLSPWQPQPSIPISPFLANVTYADPTPWAPPEPKNYDSFLGGGRMPLYARIMWGSGGIQHTAFVDWPRRGCLLQVSGNYVQVNAFVNVGLTATPETLPLVSATLAPEPGGGDAVMPATFTYRPESGSIDPVVPPYGFRNFQIPPFARAFLPLINWTQAINVGIGFRFATITPNLMGVAGGIGANSTNVVQSWQTAFPATTADQDRFMEPIPIAGQDAADVRIETDGIINIEYGVMFLLDL